MRATPKPRIANATRSAHSLQRMVMPLAELTNLVQGREIELHMNPLAGPVWARASVYVRGDERDNYSTCVASGNAGTIDAALRRAVKDWVKRHNATLSHEEGGKEQL